MSSVPLRVSLGGERRGGNSLPELLQTPSGLALVEVQGTLNVPGSDAEPPNETQEQVDLHVGHLVFPDYQSETVQGGGDTSGLVKRVHLYVGKNQRLTGEVKKLPKPMAVIQKRKEDGGMEVDGVQEELEIVEIVRYKILFAHRPEPVG